MKKILIIIKNKIEKSRDGYKSKYFISQLGAFI
jgi:hypothetical protein